MTSLSQIKINLWEELSELCEAVDLEHAWLEEGPGKQENILGDSPYDIRDAA